MKLLRLLLVGLIVVLGTAPTVAAQEDATPFPLFELPALVLPSLDPPTWDRFDRHAPEDGYLGELTENPYRQDSITNPYGRFGNPYAPNGLNNPYSASGSPYSPSSATKPLRDGPPPLIIGSDGQYLGRLSANPLPAGFGNESVRTLWQSVLAGQHHEPLRALRQPLQPAQPDQPVRHSTAADHRPRVGQQGGGGPRTGRRRCLTLNLGGDPVSVADDRSPPAEAARRTGRPERSPRL